MVNTLAVLLVVASCCDAELISVWSGSTGWRLVATCSGPNATACPPGMTCGAETPGECGAAPQPDGPSCSGCNYSGGHKPQCKVVCPKGTRLSVYCADPWLAPPNTTPCSGGAGCVKATNNTCDEKPLRCVVTACD